MFSVNNSNPSSRTQHTLVAVPSLLLWLAPCDARSQSPDNSQFGFIGRSSQVPVRQRSQPATPLPPSGIPLPDPALTGTGTTTEVPAADASTGNSAPAAETSAQSTADSPSVPTPGILEDVLPSWLRLEIGLQSMYDSNIFLQTEDEDADWVNRVTPRITAFMGDPTGTDWYGEARYTPAWTTYASNSEINRFDQGGAVEGTFRQPLLTMTGGLSYQENTGNDRFTRDLFTTTTTRAYTSADYVLGPSTFLEGSMGWSRMERGASLQNTRTRFNDQDSFDVRAAALWQLSAATRLGPAVRYERIDSSVNVDRDIVHTLVAINYNPESIFTLRGDLGAQWVSLASGRTSWAPSAALSGLWDVDALWKVGMGVYSRSLPSPTGVNSTQQSTGITADVSWVPDELLLVAAGLGYEFSDFEVYNAPSQSREDDYFFGNLSLRVTPSNAALGIEFFYRYRFTDSSLADLDFSNSQAGVQLNYRF